MTVWVWERKGRTWDWWEGEGENKSIWGEAPNFDCCLAQVQVFLPPPTSPHLHLRAHLPSSLPFPRRFLPGSHTQRDPSQAEWCFPSRIIFASARLARYHLFFSISFLFFFWLRCCVCMLTRVGDNCTCSCCVLRSRVFWLWNRTSCHVFSFLICCQE